MKNLEQLNLSEKNRKDIIRTAENYQRFLGIQTTILEIGSDFITVKIEQVSKKTDQVFTAPELVSKAKEVFSHLEGLYQVRVRPLIFKGEGIEAVSAEWVKSMLKKHGLYQADIVRDFGIDKPALSKLLANETGFTRWHKAAFYYYFKARQADKNV